MSHFTVGTENGAKERSMRIRLHSLLAWLIARGYRLIGVLTLNHQARILADWALSMFFRADTIPLSDLIPSGSSCRSGHPAIREEPPRTPAAQVVGLLTR